MIIFMVTPPFMYKIGIFNILNFRSRKGNYKLHLLTSEKTIFINLIGIIAIWFWTIFKNQLNFHTFLSLSVTYTRAYIILYDVTL